jgi:hypothetical protein
VDEGKVREKLDVIYFDLIFISLPHRRLGVVAGGRAMLVVSCTAGEYSGYRSSAARDAAPGMLSTETSTDNAVGVDDRQEPMVSSLTSLTMCTLCPRTRVSCPVSSSSSHRTSK